MKKITVNQRDIAELAILYGKNEPESTAFAAEELARYIKAASGAELPIRAVDAIDCESAVILGAELNPGLYDGSGEEDWIPWQKAMTPSGFPKVIDWMISCLDSRPSGRTEKPSFS